MIKKVLNLYFKSIDFLENYFRKNDAISKLQKVRIE